MPKVAPSNPYFGDAAALPGNTCLVNGKNPWDVPFCWPISFIVCKYFGTFVGKSNAAAIWGHPILRYMI